MSQNDQQGIAHVWALFSAAPSKHRNLMLRGILAQCCFPQLSFLSNSVGELVRIDFLTALPVELGFKILCFLDTTSLCKAAQVSQRWRTLADDDVIWHRMCEQHIDRKCQKCGWGLPLLERKRLRASKRQIQLRAKGRENNGWLPDTTPLGWPLASDEVSQPPAIAAGPIRGKDGEGDCQATEIQVPEELRLPQRFRPWKDVYKDRFKVGSNWKHGRYSTKIFKGHTNGVMCLQFDDHILATGSYDSTIKIWDIETGEEIRTLRGHRSGIRCLQFDDNKLISGSLDHDLRVWNWHTGECLRTITGHENGVISLHFVSTLLASGSIDSTIRLWNFEDKSLSVFRGHGDWVNAVKIDLPSRTLFSASDDLTIRLWDLDTKTTIKVFKGHVGQVQQVVPLPPEFDLEDENPHDSSDDSGSATSLSDILARISGNGLANGGGTSAAPNAPSTPISPSAAFGASFSAHDRNRPLPPRHMLTSALDGTIRLWDVASAKCLRTFFGHVEGVWALAADTLRVVSGAEDRMVKVWDARSGRCERTFTGHAGPVTCIGLSDSRMCTGSEDCEVRMMSFKSEAGRWDEEG